MVSAGNPLRILLAGSLMFPSTFVAAADCLPAQPPAYRDVRERIEERKYQDAIAGLRPLIGSGRCDATALFLLAVVYSRQGHPLFTQNSLEKARGCRPALLPCLRARANQLLGWAEAEQAPRTITRVTGTASIPEFDTDSFAMRAEAQALRPAPNVNLRDETMPSEPR